jgi:hypothetical protein
MRSTKILLSLAIVASLLLAVSPGQTAQPMYPRGTVTIDLTSVAVGIGTTWGKGTLRYDGKAYSFSVSGMSLGNVGIATATAVGNVYNLKKPSDLAGTYAAAGAGLTLAGGMGGITMRNDKGVIINLYTVQSGLQLNIGPQGFTIEMR